MAELARRGRFSGNSWPNKKKDHWACRQWGDEPEGHSNQIKNDTTRRFAAGKDFERVWIIEIETIGRERYAKCKPGVWSRPVLW